MGIDGGSLREVLDGATPDELRGVLLALEGRVVHVGAVTGLLERLQPPATAPVARSSRSSSSSSSDSAVVQQPTATLKTSSSDCAVSSPAPATKRARCGDAPDGGGGGGPAAAAAANSGRSAAPPPPAAKDASGTGGSTASAPPDAEMTAPGNPGSKSSGRSAGTDDTPAAGSNEASSTRGGTAAGESREASSTQGLETGHTRAAASQSLVPPQGPRGLSWREKQRQKAAEKEAGGGGGGGNKKRRKSKKEAGQQRDFDHSRWRKRTIAVQLMYEGGGYAGFCSQSEGNEETIEKHLFRALTTTKLVETIATGDNYSRCGRTDRGVSALGNVITVSMRSKFPKHVPDADLPTSPLGSLWVGPTAPPPNGAESVEENDGGFKKENQMMPEGSDAAEQEQPAAGVADKGSGLAKDKNSEGCPSDSRHPASGASEPCAAAGGGEVGRGEVASGNPPGGRGGGGSSVIAGAADAGAGENGGGGGGGRLRGSEGERGGGLGGGNGNGKTKKKHKKKSRMGGGSGGGGPPDGGEVTEIDYCGILNRVLPPGVRALAWAPVTEGFSARFSCSDRTYRYFFMARDMNINAMNEAASKIVGSHDFRNLCKIDVANVSNFVRHIKHASVRPVPSPSSSNTSDQDGTARGEEEEEYYRVCVFEVQ
ncbi:unnamed protein product [Ectocarpus sp. 12 AP-2014]